MRVWRCFHTGERLLRASRGAAVRGTPDRVTHESACLLYLERVNLGATIGSMAQPFILSVCTAVRHIVLLPPLLTPPSPKTRSLDDIDQSQRRYWWLGYGGPHSITPQYNAGFILKTFISGLTEPREGALVVMRENETVFVVLRCFSVPSIVVTLIAYLFMWDS